MDQLTEKRTDGWYFKKPIPNGEYWFNFCRKPTRKL